MQPTRLSILNPAPAIMRQWTYRQSLGVNAAFDQANASRKRLLVEARVEQLRDVVES